MAIRKSDCVLVSHHVFDDDTEDRVYVNGSPQNTYLITAIEKYLDDGYEIKACTAVYHPRFEKTIHTWTLVDL